MCVCVCVCGEKLLIFSCVWRILPTCCANAQMWLMLPVQRILVTHHALHDSDIIFPQLFCYLMLCLCKGKKKKKVPSWSSHGSEHISDVSQKKTNSSGSQYDPCVKLHIEAFGAANAISAHGLVCFFHHYGCFFAAYCRFRKNIVLSAFWGLFKYLSTSLSPFLCNHAGQMGTIRKNKLGNNQFVFTSAPNIHRWKPKPGVSFIFPPAPT